MVRFLFFVSLLLSVGCASPFVGSVGKSPRCAEEQKNLTIALQTAMLNGAPQLVVLSGKRVLLVTRAVSGADVSETDAAFVENFIRQKLVAARAIVVEPGEEEVVLLVQVCSFGVDTINRAYPFIILPLFYQAKYTASVELDIFAYNKGDLSVILGPAKWTGSSLWGHMAILGVGPF
ncbi:MAG: hypothetical protein N2234_07120 [Planctomycetota bacterium]|nr:hypothetical protein [Planctomycetota bacterium]